MFVHHSETSTPPKFSSFKSKLKLIESPIFSIKFRLPITSPTIKSKSLSPSISNNVGWAWYPTSKTLFNISFSGDIPTLKLIIFGLEEVFSR